MGLMASVADSFLPFPEPNQFRGGKTRSAILVCTYACIYGDGERRIFLIEPPQNKMDRLRRELGQEPEEHNLVRIK